MESLCVMVWGLTPAENSSAAAAVAAVAPPGGRSGNLRFLHDRALEQRSRRDTTGKSLRITLRVFLVFSPESQTYRISSFFQRTHPGKTAIFRIVMIS